MKRTIKLPGRPICTREDYLAEARGGHGQCPVGSRLELVSSVRAFKAFSNGTDKECIILRAGTIVERLHGILIQGPPPRYAIPVRLADGQIWFISASARVEID